MQNIVKRFETIGNLCVFNDYLSVDQSLLDPFVFVAGLQRNGVHATLTAVVSGAQPVLFNSLKGRVAPREEISARNVIKKCD